MSDDNPYRSPAPDAEPLVQKSQRREISRLGRILAFFHWLIGGGLIGGSLAYGNMPWGTTPSVAYLVAFAGILLLSAAFLWRNDRRSIAAAVDLLVVAILVIAARS